MSHKKRNTSGLKVISRRDYGRNGRVTEYLFSVTGDKTVERTNFLIELVYTRDVPEQKDKWTGKVWQKAHVKGDYEYTRRTETRQKLLCVGGPLAGQRITAAIGYHSYNVAAFNRGRSFRPGRDAELQRCIFVHESVLEG